MNEVSRVFRNNTLASVKALKGDEEFIRELIEIIAEDYDIKGLFADAEPDEVLETVDMGNIIKHVVENGYMLVAN